MIVIYLTGFVAARRGAAASDVYGDAPHVIWSASPDGDILSASA
jgi:hypothetical protein